MKKTKIICTIGPSSIEKKVLREMIKEGMNVARINLSHGDYAFSEKVIENINDLNNELGTTVSILVDTKGPEVRVGKIKNGRMKLETNSFVKIETKEIEGSKNKFSLTYPDFIKDIDIDNKILLDDGSIELEVIEKLKTSIKCKVLNGGVLYSNKGVNFPGVKMNIPFMSETDKNDIVFAANRDVDFIALSYTTSKEDVLEANDMLITLDNDHIQLISKIENEEGVQNIDEILKVSDGVMIARGDLGVEVPIEKLPTIQKDILELAHKANKISIVATQMLDSMETNNKPTRAEVTDIHNAVLDGTDAVMLSGETTIGKYPVEAVKIMSKIAESAEEEIDYLEMMNRAMEDECENITTAISSSVVNSAYLTNAKAIVASTYSGYTAKMVSHLRPKCPILATTPVFKTAKRLTLNWGVYPVVVDMFETTDEIVEDAVVSAKRVMGLEPKDKIIITGGIPLTTNKKTNFMKIEEIK